MAQKAYKVGLKDGKIAIEGVDDFSIDIEDPKLNVGTERREVVLGPFRWNRRTYNDFPRARDRT